MKKYILLLALILLGCDKRNLEEMIKEISENSDDGSYPISPDKKLAYRQGKFFSLDFEFNIGSSENNEEKNERQKKEDCDIFFTSIAYISENYPIKQIDNENKIIITDTIKNLGGSQITIFAKNKEEFIISSQNKELSLSIKNKILSRCNKQ